MEKRFNYGFDLFPLLAIFISIPMMFYFLIDSRVPEDKIWIILVIIPICLLSFLIFLKDLAWIFTAHHVFRIFYGISLVILVFAIEKKFDSSNLFALVFFDINIVLGFISISTHFYLMNKYVIAGGQGDEVIIRRLKLADLQLIIAAIFAMISVFASSLFVFLRLIGLFIVLDTGFFKDIKDPNSKKIKMTGLVASYRFLDVLQFLLVSIMLFLIASLSLHYSVYTSKTTLSFLMFGVIIGIFFDRLMKFESRWYDLLFPALGLLVMFSLFYINPELIKNDHYMFIGGFFIGGSFQSFMKIIGRPTFASGGAFNLSLFLILALSFGVGFLLQEVYFVIKYNLDYLYWGFVGLAILFLILIISNYTLQALVPKIEDQFKWFFGKIQERIMDLRINRSKIAAMMIIGVFLGGTGITLLSMYTPDEITIQLPVPMYDVDGNELFEVKLKSMSGKILFYSPNPQFNGSETIRPGKTIRIGGYYYGLEMNTSDAVQWIANTNDVFSLGLMGNTISANDILTIRNINPNVLFYYMAFATSLFENPNAQSENGTWGLSHYPEVKFNETMHSWTVKYLNGTEALGVRRDSHSSNAHLMDLAKLEWADYFAWIYTKRAQEYHANGVAIDEVMWRGYWGTKYSELQGYSDTEHMKQVCLNWLARLRSQTSMEIITQAFWAEPMQYQDGVWGEIAFRSGGNYGERVNDKRAEVWYESMNWLEIVENMKGIAEANKSYIWAAWYERDNSEALEYALATYLMGKPNNTTKLVFHPHPIYDGGYPANLAGYSTHTVQQELIRNSKYFDIELGQASSSFYKVSRANGSYFQRNFTNGIVLVNPYRANVPGFSIPGF
jgi:hypothetical protein